MALIDVQVGEEQDHYTCTVTVKEGQNSTQHRVSLDKEDYRRLTQGRATPAELVEASFRFLLEREPPSSILRSFDLMTINRYFPEYEQEITQRLLS